MAKLDNYGVVAATKNTGAVGDVDTKTETINWGVNAKRSMYHVTNSLSADMNGATGAKGAKTGMGNRLLLDSRLWHGVPQLTRDQMQMFEAAYTGHTFIFVVNVPKFMVDGLYKDSNMHAEIKNLKAVIERASTGFSGVTEIEVGADDQNDGAGRKVSHITSVTKEQGNITLKLHEFAGLPVKNALEAWVTGIYDYRSQHGNYHGNLNIKNGWCLANHSMSILVVQVTPDWSTIQDAAYYYNMVPVSVPFDDFEWEKGESTIIADRNIEFYANEERSPAIMYAAEKYMNNRVLSMVATSVYNSRQFVVDHFENGTLINDKDSITERLDDMQYNQYIQNVNGEEYTTGKNNNAAGTMVGQTIAKSSLDIKYADDVN